MLSCAPRELQTSFLLRRKHSPTSSKPTGNLARGSSPRHDLGRCHEVLGKSQQHALRLPGSGRQGNTVVLFSGAFEFVLPEFFRCERPQLTRLADEFFWLMRRNGQKVTILLDNVFDTDVDQAGCLTTPSCN
eukprot:5677647-Amphidinium_carterae.1